MARSAIVAARAQQHGQFIHQAWIPGNLNQRCFETFLRFNELSRCSQYAAETDMGLEQRRVQVDGTIKTVDGLHVLAKLVQSAAQIVICARRVRIALDGIPVASCRAQPLAPSEVGLAETIVPPGRRGIEFDRLLERGHRCVDIAPRQQRVTEPASMRCIARAASYEVLQHRNCFVGTLRIAQYLCQSDMSLSVCRCQHEQPAAQNLCLHEASRFEMKLQFIQKFVDGHTVEGVIRHIDELRSRPMKAEMIFAYTAIPCLELTAYCRGRI
jgi:hypothetical protein